MRENIRLDVTNLSVESFTTAPALTQPAPEHLTTCLETDCGGMPCCA
ncbi:MAG TPA: hypothetical protein VF541_22335 [Longimicrobium sp.]